MFLSDLIADLEGVLDSEKADPEIKRVIHDSREIVEGDIFCCIKGQSANGHNYIKAVSYTHLTLPTNREV